MNRIEITIEGPVMENLARVTVADDYDEDVFTVAFDDVVAARAEGDQAVLDLIAENCGDATQDIVSAAIANESPVYLDGADVDPAALAAAFGVEAPKPATEITEETAEVAVSPEVRPGHDPREVLRDLIGFADHSGVRSYWARQGEGTAYDRVLKEAKRAARDETADRGRLMAAIGDVAGFVNVGDVRHFWARRGESSALNAVLNKAVPMLTAESRARAAEEHDRVISVDDLISEIGEHLAEIDAERLAKVAAEVLEGDFKPLSDGETIRCDGVKRSAASVAEDVVENLYGMDTEEVAALADRLLTDAYEALPDGRIGVTFKENAATPGPR